MGRGRAVKPSGAADAGAAMDAEMDAGAEMMPEPDVEGASNRARDWTPRRRQRFLDALRGCCDEVKACRTVRMTIASLYRLMDDDHHFADACHGIIDTLYVRLELALLRMALAPAPAGVQPAQRDLAHKLLALHDARKKLRANGRWPHPKVKRATPEQTDAAILKHLAALDRRIKMEEEEAQAEAAARGAEEAAARDGEAGGDDLPGDASQDAQDRGGGTGPSIRPL